jgi:hypothetical protein
VEPYTLRAIKHEEHEQIEAAGTASLLHYIAQDRIYNSHPLVVCFSSVNLIYVLFMCLIVLCIVRFHEFAFSDD